LDDGSAAPTGGIDFEDLARGGSRDPNRNCGASKVGNWLLTVERARLYGGEGIVSGVQNPGNLRSDVWRHLPRLMAMMLRPLLYEARMGALTELYAGLSGEIGVGENGRYIIPWGRLQEGSPRGEIIEAMKGEEDGGRGVAERF